MSAVLMPRVETVEEIEEPLPEMPTAYIGKYANGYGWAKHDGLTVDTSQNIHLCIAGVQFKRIADPRDCDFFTKEEGMIVRATDCRILPEAAIPLLREIAINHGVNLVVL